MRTLFDTKELAFNAMQKLIDQTPGAMLQADRLNGIGHYVLAYSVVMEGYKTQFWISENPRYFKWIVMYCTTWHDGTMTEIKYL